MPPAAQCPGDKTRCLERKEVCECLLQVCLIWEMGLAIAGFIPKGQISRPELLGPVTGGAFTESIIHNGLTYLATWFASWQTHLKIINQTTPNEMFDFVILPHCCSRHGWCVCTTHPYCLRAMPPPQQLSWYVKHLFAYQWSFLSTRHKKTARTFWWSYWI